MISRPCLLEILEAALLDQIILPSDLEKLCMLVSQSKAWSDSEPGAQAAADICEEQLIPDGCYQGTIKSFNLNKGYGFISCPELLDKHGCDVFMHRNQFFACSGDLSVGESVIFRIELSKHGKPQARDLHKYFTKY